MQIMSKSKKWLSLIGAGLAIIFLITATVSTFFSDSDAKQGEKQVGLVHYSGKLLQRAKKGDAEAQYNLGNCYYYGLGIEKNYDEAVKWFRQSAEQDYAPAQNDLGDCYQRGIGVEKDEAEAERWWQKASRIRE